MRPAPALPLPERRPGGAWLLSLIGLLTLGMIALVLAQAAGFLPHLAAPALGIASQPTVAYTFIGGEVAKVNAATGAILARQPYHLATQGPSLAVSRDGKAVFVLDSEFDGTKAVDHLTVLTGDTLQPQLRVPADGYAQYMGAWPPALTVTEDDRIVAVYHISRDNAGLSPWLTYFDRQAGQFTGDSTPLPGCGSAQLIPIGQRLAVLCLHANEVRLIDLASRQVTGAIALSRPRAGNRSGWAVVAGVIPGTAALAVVLDNARLVRVDLAAGTASTRANFAAGDEQIVPLKGATFTSDGRVVVALSRNTADRSRGLASTLLVADMVTGKTIDQFAQPTYAGITTAPDGRRLLSRIPEGGLNVIDLSKRRAEPFGDAPANTSPNLATAS